MKRLEIKLEENGPDTGLQKVEVESKIHKKNNIRKHESNFQHGSI